MCKHLYILGIAVLLVGFAALNWIWQTQSDLEKQIAGSQRMSDVDKLLGSADHSFGSKSEMVNQIEGGSFVFCLLPDKSNRLDVHALPEIDGTACFYLDSMRGDYLIYFEDGEVVSVYWAGT